MRARSLARENIARYSVHTINLVSAFCFCVHMHMFLSTHCWCRTIRPSFHCINRYTLVMSWTYTVSLFSKRIDETAFQCGTDVWMDGRFAIAKCPNKCILFDYSVQSSAGVRDVRMRCAHKRLCHVKWFKTNRNYHTTILHSFLFLFRSCSLMHLQPTRNSFICIYCIKFFS